MLIHIAASSWPGPVDVYITLPLAVGWPVVFSRPGDWPLAAANTLLSAGMDQQGLAVGAVPPLDTATLWAALIAGITGHPDRLPADPAARLHLLAALAEYDLAIRPDGGPLTSGQAWGLHAGAAPQPLFRELRRALAAHAVDPAAVPGLSGVVLTVEADPDSADPCWYRLDLAAGAGELSACSSGETLDAVAADLIARQPC